MHVSALLFLCSDVLVLSQLAIGTVFLTLNCLLLGPSAGFFVKRLQENLVCDRRNVNDTEVVHTLSEAGLWLHWVRLFLFLLLYLGLGGLIVHRAAH